jgi:hypothetical protein
MPQIVIRVICFVSTLDSAAANADAPVIGVLGVAGGLRVLLFD